MANYSMEVYHQYSNSRSHQVDHALQKAFFEQRPKLTEHPWAQSEPFTRADPHSPPSPRSRPRTKHSSSGHPELRNIPDNVQNSPALSCLDDSLLHLPQLRVWSQDENENEPQPIDVPTNPSRSRERRKSRSRSREPLAIYASSAQSSHTGERAGAIAIPSSRSSSRGPPPQLGPSSWNDQPTRASSPFGRSYSASHIESSAGWPSTEASRRSQSASHIDLASGWPTNGHAHTPPQTRSRSRSPLPLYDSTRTTPRNNSAGIPPPPALLHPDSASDPAKKKQSRERSRSRSPRPHTPYPLPMPTVPSNGSSPMLTLPDGLRVHLHSGELQIANGALVIPKPRVPVRASTQPFLDQRLPAEKATNWDAASVPLPLSRRPTTLTYRESQIDKGLPSSDRGFAPGSLPSQGYFPAERGGTLPRRDSTSVTGEGRAAAERALPRRKGSSTVIGESRSLSVAPDITTSKARYPQC